MKRVDGVRIKGRLEEAPGGASGYVLFAQQEVEVPPGQCRMVPAGVEIEGMPQGMMAHVCGMQAMLREGVLCVPAVMDGAQGEEIVLTVFNAGSGFFRVEKGSCVGRLFFSLALHPPVAAGQG